MRFREPLIKLAVLSVMAAGVAACGPTKVKLDPKSVVNVSVQPASGQPLFCPGDAFQIELLAKLKDGSTCSSTDRKRGCLGEKDAVIDPADVRVSGSSGRITGPPEKFIWTPDSNPLATADTGMTLKGWIEKLVNGTVEKSIEGEAALKPVYDCQSERVFTATRDGGAGPDLIIAVTTLSTPYYPNAALIRVENGPDRMYFISSAADQPVKIISKGGAGAQGAQGSQGQPGADGKSADGSSMCAKGGSGGDGGSGGAGGPGGDGGNGGRIKIIIDKAAADKLKGRILVGSNAGEAGSGGYGGQGGRGGRGGSGGRTGPDCSDNKGVDGTNGPDGPQGPSGRPGQNGPSPTFETGARASLFGTEMGTISKIEAAQGKN